MREDTIIYIIFLAFCITGCGPARIITETQKDSVIVRIRDSVFIRDTAVMAPIPAESGTNALQDTDTSYLQTSLAESRAFVSDGILHHTLRNRHEQLLPVTVQYVDRARFEKSEALAQRETIQTVEVEKDLNWWQRFRLALGDAALILAAAWAIWTLTKLFRA